MTQALNDAGFPEDHLPSRSAADFFTGGKAAIGWKAKLTRGQLNAAMAVMFLRTRYSNGQPGGLLLMWHPTTRWLYARLTGPRKAAEPDFHRWIDRKLLDGATRYARIRAMVDQHEKGAVKESGSSDKKRSGRLPKPDFAYFPRIIVLSDGLHDDGYEPNFSDWHFEPRVTPKGFMGDSGDYVFNLRDLPSSGSPHDFISHIFGGYIFEDFLFTIGRRGKRYKVMSPQISVPGRLGIIGDKGRRWRNLLRMPEFGESRSKRGPFESSRRRKSGKI
ncbi:hypothetical protein [Sphingomonas cynarae]|uniref:hypothetical protein n=1 Tax=Sphingomonas cynarae TaxID=930197 RepID=UPI0031D33A6E